MENFELYIDTHSRINRQNGQFVKGHTPFNKGLPMDQWMDCRKKRRVLKYLEIGRKQGNHDLAGHNKRPVVGIKDGKLFPFDSGTSAAKILRERGIKVNARNINSVCNCQIIVIGRYAYTRKRAGGFQWFFADEPEKYTHLLN